jgi:hypothetical protein
MPDIILAIFVLNSSRRLPVVSRSTPGNGRKARGEFQILADHVANGIRVEKEDHSLFRVENSRLSHR